MNSGFKNCIIDVLNSMDVCFLPVKFPYALFLHGGIFWKMSKFLGGIWIRVRIWIFPVMPRAYLTFALLYIWWASWSQLPLSWVMWPRYLREAPVHEVGGQSASYLPIDQTSFILCIFFISTIVSSLNRNKVLWFAWYLAFYIYLRRMPYMKCSLSLSHTLSHTLSSTERWSVCPPPCQSVSS